MSKNYFLHASSIGSVWVPCNVYKRNDDGTYNVDYTDPISKQARRQTVAETSLLHPVPKPQGSYQVVKSYNGIAALETMVNSLIAGGWEPIGGVQVNPGRVSSDVCFQAMVKRD
jgi:hypothetical protein